MAKGLIALLLALAMGGCATMMSASSYCRIYKPVLISKNDKMTAGTARQIRKRNEQYADLCVE